jgi:predicted DNA-binding transcriptional regulator AlpA
MQTGDSTEGNQSPPNRTARSQTLLDSNATRARVGGKSHMCLWRWTRDPAVRFPAPDIVINGRRYWYEDTIDRWLSDRKVKSVP